MITDNHQFRTTQTIVTQLIPLLETLYNPALEAQHSHQLRNLAFRIILKHLNQLKSTQNPEPEYGRFSQRVLFDLDRAMPSPKINGSDSAQLATKIEQLLNNCICNALAGYGFNYLNPARPSFFLGLDATGQAEKCDWTTLYRNYHIPIQEPFEGIAVYDAEFALSYLERQSGYLIEVELPIYCQLLYLDDTLHRRPSAPIYQRHKMLIVSDYNEIKRYALSNSQDLEALKRSIATGIDACPNQIFSS